jgi:YD repeat-containing protein
MDEADMTISERSGRTLTDIMKHHIMGWIAIGVVAWFGAMTTRPAWATDPMLAPPKLMDLIDQNGFNLGTGGVKIAGPNISIGIPGQGGLTWQTYYISNDWDAPDWQSTIQLNLSGSTYPLYDYVVTLNGQPEAFVSTDGSSFAPTQNTGGSLSYDSGAGSYTYYRRDGVVAVFHGISVTCNTWCVKGVATTITYPSGEKLTLSYNYGTDVYALTSINSNSGYQLKINYYTDCFTFCFRKIYQVIAINNALEYCNPTANSCSLTVNKWPTLTYTYSIPLNPPPYTKIYTITDARNNDWKIVVQDNSNISYLDVTTQVRKPSGRYWELKTYWPASTLPPHQRKLDDGTGHQWVYDFGPEVDSGGQDVFATDVTDPLGHKRKVITEPSSGLPLSDVADYGSGGMNLTTTYLPDGAHIVKVTQPEGNYTQWTYDTRGNITEVRQVPKATSGAPPIVQTATYAASCTTSNFRYCNKPTSVTDAGYSAAGANVTTFTYHSDSGGVATVTSPVVSNGQPITTSTYTQVDAWYKNSASGSFVDGGPVWKPSTVSKCLADTALWGSVTWGNFDWTASGTCASESQRSLTSYTYFNNGSGSTATNALVSLVTTGSGDGVLAAVTATTYDNHSNIASITNPRGATTVYFYDLARNQTGVIGPDPDGGSANYPAIRTTYDSDGLVQKVEQGSTTTQSSITGITTLQENTTGYTSSYFAFKALDTRAMVSGGTVYPVSATQYSYDAAYNPLCTAVRENMSVLGSLPDACSPSTDGGYGRDQISRNNYDAANRVTSIQIGYGYTSPGPITKVTNAYTLNSKIAYLLDANGNRTDYTYDGYDRLSKMNFPCPDTSAPSCSTPHSSNSYDFEQYGYDANGNQTSKRLRSGETITYTYDALGRLTARTFPAPRPAMSIWAMTWSATNFMPVSAAPTGQGSHTPMTPWDGSCRKRPMVRRWPPNMTWLITAPA